MLFSYTQVPSILKLKEDTLESRGGGTHMTKTEQVAEEDNNRSPEEQLAQGMNIIRNSKRPSKTF